MHSRQQSWRSIVVLVVFFGVALATLGSFGPQVAAATQGEGLQTVSIPEIKPAALAQGAQLTYVPTVISNATATAAADGWSQLGGNPQRTHFVHATLPARAGTLSQDWEVLWVWNGPAGQDAGPAAGHLSLPDSMTPVVGDGRLYVGHSDGVARALNAATGAQLWATTLGGSLENSGAYDRTTGTVFFASTNGRLYKLRATDGTNLGNFNAGAAIEQAVLLVDDTVYIGTRGGNLYAVNTTTMAQRWVYNAGAPITASAAYASKDGGLIIFPSENGQVHAVRATTGARKWNSAVNIFERPARDERPARYFPDVYAVVAEAADVVIIRSYFDWQKTWADADGAPVNQSEVRQFLETNPTYESFFVLDLDDGTRPFTAPVLGGAMGNGDHYYSSPPQVVVRRLPDGSDVAYLLWRNRSACLFSANCDGREDTTIGEMNLSTGTIRFVEDYKNEGTIRFPTDEQGALSMVGNVLFHAHWMSLGAIRIPNRELGGSSYGSPIPSQEYLSVTNTLAQGQCAQRDSARRYCPVGHSPPGDGYQLDPGFYIYYYNQNVYDPPYWHPPVRGPIYDSGVVYWRSSDGAIIAMAPTGVVVPEPSPSSSPSTSPSSSPSTSPSSSPSTSPSSSPSTSPAPSKTPVRRAFEVGLPSINR